MAAAQTDLVRLQGETFACESKADYEDRIQFKRPKVTSLSLSDYTRYGIISHVKAELYLIGYSFVKDDGFIPAGV